MSPEEQQNDMSMEDILSSIKDILENDGQEKTTAETMPSEPEDVTPAVPTEFQSVEPNKEDDVFDLSKAMIVDDASQEGDSKIELDEIGPDFDITPKEDEPLLAPDDMVLPDFKNEAFDEDNEKSVVQEDVMASSESEKMPEDDFSFNIDEILQSASEAMSEDSEMSSNENIEQSGSDNIEDNIFDVSDIDITSDPIFEQENNSFMDFVSEEQTDAENVLTAEDDIQQSEFDDSFLEEKTEDISSVSQINEIPAAVDEDPQEIPEAEFSEVEEISIPEEEPSEVPEELPDADSVRVAWKDVLTDYMRYNVEAESKLVQGYANFDYSQVGSLSDSLWSKAYNLVNKGNQFVDMLSNSTEEQYFELKQNILMDLSLVYTQLYGYYGQMVDRGSVIPEDQLIEQMESLSMYINGNRRYALSVMLAKVHLLRQDWQGAAYSCEEVIASGVYRLEPQLDHTMVSSSESKEVIYGDFYADGKYIHPLLYKEVLIMAAYANFKMGTINKALQFVNELLASYGYAPVSIDEVESTLQEFVAKLYGTGQSYPYARILSMKLGVNGFETPKNWFLPVPESALLSCPNLQQNPGY